MIESKFSLAVSATPYGKRALVARLAARASSAEIEILGDWLNPLASVFKRVQ
jgi:hypothetical protein